MSRIASLLWRWGPVAAYVALAYALSLDPATPTPGTPGVDKVLHLVEYGCLGLLLARGARGPRQAWAVALLVAVGLAVGIGDELIQSTVPTRTACAPDAIADLVGVTLGVVLGSRLWIRPALARWV